MLVAVSSGMANTPVSFGWIMQAAFFQTPAGSEPGDSRLAHDLIAANEEHIEIVRQGGISTVWVEDHLRWEDRAHLECFTNMAWLAGRHPDMRYGTMVCGQAFRNPSLLAKMALNMHLLTEGKFILGLGAGNQPGEHHEYGYAFLSPGERVAQTEEAAKIIKALWTQSPATFNGQYYSVENAHCSPLPASPIPLMIGGMGEKKLLRLVAEHADWWCCDLATVEQFSHKARVLAEHCAAVGRDPSSITHAMVTWISVEEDSSRAESWSNMPLVSGDPDDVTRQLEAFREAGVEHFQIRFLDYPNPAGLERFLAKVMPRLV